MHVTVGAKSLRATATLIPPDVPHSFVVDGRVIFMWADPHGPRGRRLKERAIRDIGRDISTEIHGLGDIAADADVSTDLARRLMRSIGEEVDESSRTSDHVSAAVAYLEAAIALDRDGGRAPRLAQAAGAAGISPSRLTHVFTEEMGIPFRRYVQWVRLLLAVRAIAAGQDLTRAASAAGFSDSAHLSRAFRKTFGLPPSTLLALQLVTDAW
jgi:AraC-like DNA-binding protein